MVGRDLDPVWRFFDSTVPRENPKAICRGCGETLAAAAIAVAAAAPFIIGRRPRLPPLIHALLLPVIFFEAFFGQIPNSCGEKDKIDPANHPGFSHKQRGEGNDRELGVAGSGRGGLAGAGSGK